MENGHCVVCEVVGRGRSDFVCENCGNPDGVVVYCACCRGYREGTEHLLELIERSSGMSIPRRGGISIRVNGCATCAVPDATITTELFSLRRRHLH